MTSQSDVEAVARALYECWPEEDSGEYVDGFRVSPGGPIPWSAIVEMGHDEPYRVAARAALAADPGRRRMRSAMTRLLDAFTRHSCPVDELQAAVKAARAALAEEDQT